MSNFVTLLVEDDPFQREVLAVVLKDEGFEVIECTTAEAAELSKMSGAELAHYARRRHPHMNIVIMSGTTVHPMPVGTAFLRKPFPPERLLDMVRE